MAKIKYTWEVLYQEIDANRRMRLFTLENHLLTVAGKVADEFGYGQQYLFKQGLTWIITNCSVEMQKMPTAGDKLVFETWIESNAHMLSIRDLNIYLISQPLSLSPSQPILIGRAKTTWAVLDLEKREIVNVFDQPAFQDIVDGEVLDMPRPLRMSPIDSQSLGSSGPTPRPIYSSTTINYSCVDYNNHCNSCKYPEFMLDVYKPDWLDKPFRFDIRYVKEMRLGQNITTLCQNVNNHINYQQKDETGDTVCAAQIYPL